MRFLCGGPLLLLAWPNAVKRLHLLAPPLGSGQSRAVARLYSASYCHVRELFGCSKALLSNARMCVCGMLKHWNRSALAFEQQVLDICPGLSIAVQLVDGKSNCTTVHLLQILV